MPSYAISACLCCQSTDLQPVLDLGQHPQANKYETRPTNTAKRYPLGLNLCRNCWHSQLTYCIDRKELFDNYLYVSGTSATLNSFFKWFADCLSRALPPGARVLEIAANDGSLIKEMINTGLRATGIDPANNIVEHARAKGIPVIQGYWPDASRNVDGTFDAIVCMNVLAHVDDPLNFLSRCKDKLATGGRILIQPSQARMIENGEFDTIYHEHISFFNSNSISQLAKKTGLKLVEAFFVKIHGDSPVYLLAHDEDPPRQSFRDHFSNGEFSINEDLLEYERRAQLYNIETYNRFRERALYTIDAVRNTIFEHRARGFQVVFVGAAAKAMTLLNAAQILPDVILDENPLKIGKFAPGCNVIVKDLNSCQAYTIPTLFVLAAWNFRIELAAKIRNYGIPACSRFYAYFPEPHLL